MCGCQYCSKMLTSVASGETAYSADSSPSIRMRYSDDPWTATPAMSHSSAPARRHEISRFVNSAFLGASKVVRVLKIPMMHLEFVKFSDSRRRFAGMIGWALLFATHEHLHKPTLYDRRLAEMKRVCSRILRTYLHSPVPHP